MEKNKLKIVTLQSHTLKQMKGGATNDGTIKGNKSAGPIYKIEYNELNESSCKILNEGGC